MNRNLNQFPRRYETATMLSLVLPNCCPNCAADIFWGWTDEGLDAPCGGHAVGSCAVHIRCIPRPDQTVFCPNCEAQILN